MTELRDNVLADDRMRKNFSFMLDLGLRKVGAGCFKYKVRKGQFE